MAISKKIRFEVFKRDNFTCQYCGKTPPNILLEADHLIPKSKKGKDSINNLITSCFDCNRGKSNIELTRLPHSIKENYDILKEKEVQLKEYRKLIDRIEKVITRDCKKVSESYNDCFPDYVLTQKFIRGTVKIFIKKLDVNIVVDAMYLAGDKVNDKDESLRYFCGICWNKIKDNE